jgi:anthranilate/para-aminobenzoate synthase component II
VSARDGAFPRDAGRGRTVLVIDNYDSFVFNLVQYLGELGARTVVKTNES